MAGDSTLVRRLERMWFGLKKVRMVILTEEELQGDNKP